MPENLSIDQSMLNKFTIFLTSLHFSFIFNLLFSINSEIDSKMSEPSQEGNAKIDQAGEIPPLKREYSQRFQTMSGEDILNNRVGPQVSTRIYLINSMMKGKLHS